MDKMTEYSEGLGEKRRNYERAYFISPNPQARDRIETYLLINILQEIHPTQQRQKDRVDASP